MRRSARLRSASARSVAAPACPSMVFPHLVDGFRCRANAQLATEQARESPALSVSIRRRAFRNSLETGWDSDYFKRDARRVSNARPRALPAALKGCAGHVVRMQRAEGISFPFKRAQTLTDGKLIPTTRRCTGKTPRSWRVYEAKLQSAQHRSTSRKRRSTRAERRAPSRKQFRRTGCEPAAADELAADARKPGRRW